MKYTLSHSPTHLHTIGKSMGSLVLTWSTQNRTDESIVLVQVHHHPPPHHPLYHPHYQDYHFLRSICSTITWLIIFFQTDNGDKEYRGSSQKFVDGGKEKRIQWIHNVEVFIIIITTIIIIIIVVIIIIVIKVLIVISGFTMWRSLTHYHQDQDHHHHQSHHQLHHHHHVY